MYPLVGLEFGVMMETSWVLQAVSIAEREHSLIKNCSRTLCSRIFQNVKLRLNFVQIWSFYSHSDFAWFQIFVNLNSPKMLLLVILETLNFEFLENFGLESCSNLSKTKLWTSNAKNDIFGPFEFTKIWFHVKEQWR